jgi:hypothetical protein
MPARKLLSAKEAREQSAEKIGFMASIYIDLGDGGPPLEIPNPSLLDPDQQDRYDELQFQLEQLERYDDVLDADGKVVAKGDIKVPHRIDGVRQEPYETRLAKALLGPEDYERAIKADFRPSQVGFHWAEMRKAVEERERSDPKSVGSDPVVGDVPEAD